MTWENSAITITTLLPIVGALVIAVMPKEKDRTIRLLGILITGAALVLAVAIALGFDLHREGLQFELNVEWIPIIGARYHVGIDGISLPLYVLTFLLSFLCAIYTWRYVPEPRPHEGVPGPDAAAGDRHGRHVHRVRPDPVLRLLGDGPGPDVLPDRDLGLDEPRVRRDQVLPVHVVRVGVHAAGLPGDVLPGAGPAHLRHDRAARLRCGRAASPRRSS